MSATKQVTDILGRQVKRALDDGAEALGDTAKSVAKRRDKTRDTSSQTRGNDHYDGGSPSNSPGGSPSNSPGGTPNGPDGPPPKEIVIKPKEGWNQSQADALTEKVRRINEGNPHKPETMDTRTSNFRSDYAGEIPDGHDLDHAAELQLGGRNEQANAWPLDRSVNRSVGSQVRHQIANDAVGTQYVVNIDWTGFVARS